MTSSIANVIAAIGVLNAAAMPAAAPTEISALTTRAGRRVAFPTAAPIAAQIWTVGLPVPTKIPIRSTTRQARTCRPERELLPRSEGIGGLDLGNAAAAGKRHDLVEQDAHDQADADQQ
jgi:hypothetical protein